MTPGTPQEPEFDRYADSYEDLVNDPIRARFADSSFFHRRKWILLREFLRERQLDPAKMNWLDVGCGQGELLRIASPDFARAAGCDPSARMISACGSAEVCEQPSPVEVPFPAQSFDLVTAVCVYHHIHGEENRLRLAQSIGAVLKPGGLFAIIEHNPWNPVTRRIVNRCPVDVDAELLSPSAAARLLDRAGFETVATRYFLYLPEPLFRHAGGLERLLARVPLGGQYALFGRRPR